MVRFATPPPLNNIRFEPWAAQTRCDFGKRSNAAFFVTCPKIALRLFQGEIIYAPPPSPISGQKAFSRGGGWGCIFWGPAQQEFYTPPPPFVHPPTPRRVFSGVGGWGCIKIGPVIVSATFWWFSLQFLQQNLRFCTLRFQIIVPQKGVGKRG